MSFARNKMNDLVGKRIGLTVHKSGKKEPTI